MKQWLKDVCKTFQRDDNFQELVSAHRKLSKIKFIIYKTFDNNCTLNLKQINEALNQIKEAQDEKTI